MMCPFFKTGMKCEECGVYIKGDEYPYPHEGHCAIHNIGLVAGLGSDYLTILLTPTEFKVTPKNAVKK